MKKQVLDGQQLRGRERHLPAQEVEQVIDVVKTKEDAGVH